MTDFFATGLGLLADAALGFDLAAEEVLDVWAMAVRCVKMQTEPLPPSREFVGQTRRPENEGRILAALPRGATQKNIGGQARLQRGEMVFTTQD
ncbi:hypothetical protein AYO49_03510 [Verrucomicrobiaceae bacterium SCGC AG-212-N21]|nr:hypothetical protein AYO49_03510 [Verrucomicrobiaceae bacterium SCGC AG-212-N21]